MLSHDVECLALEEGRGRNGKKKREKELEEGSEGRREGKKYLFIILDFIF